MSFRTWMYVFAVIGLVTAVVVGKYHWTLFSGYQQDHTYERESAAKNNSTAAKKAPQDCRPTMVESGVFDWLACLGEKITSDGGVKQAEYDLKAQQDMAAWAFGMLIVTAWIAVFTLIGVVFVGWTLAATRQMALDTARVGMAQTRAMIDLESPKKCDKHIFVHAGGNLHLNAAFTNSGFMPARNMRLTGTLSIESGESADISDFCGALTRDQSAISTAKIAIPDEGIAGRRICFFGKYTYHNGHDNSGKTEVAIYADCGPDGKIPPNYARFDDGNILT